MRGSSLEQEEVAERACAELTTAPTSCPTVPLGENLVGKISNEVKPGKREEWEECFLIFCFIFYYPIVI